MGPDMLGCSMWIETITRCTHQKTKLIAIVEKEPKPGKRSEAAAHVGFAPLELQRMWPSPPVERSLYDIMLAFAVLEAWHGHLLVSRMFGRRNIDISPGLRSSIDTTRNQSPSQYSNQSTTRNLTAAG